MKKYIVTISSIGVLMFSIPLLFSCSSKEKEFNDIKFENKSVVYDGNVHSLEVDGKLPEGTTVEYINNKNTNAGYYTVQAILTCDNYKVTTLSASLTIEKANYDMSNITFDDITGEYGMPYSAEISGELPNGVFVEYENNIASSVGIHKAIANFKHNNPNYNPIPSMEATITINKGHYDMSGVSFNDQLFIYDGNEKEILIEGELPEGVTVSYENNKLTEEGEIIAVANFKHNNSNYEPIPSMEAKIKIVKSDFNLESFIFSDKEFTYDGKAHSIFIEGDISEGLKIEYENNNQINAGDYEVTAVLIEIKRNLEIGRLTANLKINKASITNINFQSSSFLHDGDKHQLRIEGELPEGVTVSYENNNHNDIGEYDVIAKFNDTTGNYNVPNDMTAKLIITEISHNIIFKEEGYDDVTIIVPDKGNLIDVPALHKIDGYIIKWDTESFENIINDIEVNSIKTPIKYKINYELNGGINNELNPNYYTIETQTFNLLVPSKEDGYVFDGWYTSLDFQKEDLIETIDLGSTGEIILYAKWIKYQLESAPDFEIDNTLDVPLVSMTVDNNISQIDLNSKIVVSKNCKWKLYKDFIGNEEFKLKAMELNVGDNIAYIIVYHDDGIHFKRYKLNIYRRDVYSYSFSSDGLIIKTDEIEEDSTLECIEEPTKEGYTFNGWIKENSEIVIFPYTANKYDGNVIFEANWKPIDYKINYELNGGVNNKINVESYTIEMPSFKFESPTKTGYTFLGWYDNSNFENKIDGLVLGTIGDKIVYAKWSTNTYKINYELNGGINNESNPNYYTIESDTIILNSPAKEGYTFAGWFINPTFINSIDSIESGTIGDIIVYAKWSANIYKINYELNGGVNNQNNMIEYNPDLSVQLYSPKRDDYDFLGWYLDDKFKEKIDFIEKGTYGNKTLYAKWEPIKYLISYELNGGFNNELNPTYHTVEDQEYILKDPIRTGYIFAGWFKESLLENKVEKIDKSANGNITVYAKWEPVIYSIVYELNNGVNSDLNITQYTIESDDFKLNKPTRTGYEFAGWFTDAEYVNSIETISKGLYGNLTIYAKWTPNLNKLTFDRNTATSGSMDSIYIYSDESVNLPKNLFSKEAFDFIGWSNTKDGEVIYQDLETYKMGLNPEYILYAIWTPHLYKIDYFNIYSDTNLKKLNTFTINDLPLNLPNPTREGYVFSGWYTNEDFSGEAVTTINALNDYKFYACWEEGSFGLEIKPIDSTSNEYAIYGYSGTDNDVIIPHQINGKKVTAIKSNAFNNTNVQSIYIPNSILNVGSNAFNNDLILFAESSSNEILWNQNLKNEILYNCSLERGIDATGLKWIKTNNDTISIYGCVDNKNIKEITIPLQILNYNVDEVINLGSTKFLNFIVIKNNILKIRANAFKNCQNLVVFCEGGTKNDGWNSSWDFGIKTYYSYGGKHGETVEGLKWYLRNDNAISIYDFVGGVRDFIAIPDEINNYKVDTILDNSFTNHDHLAMINIPESVKNIGDSAFDMICHYGNTVIFYNGDEIPAGWNTDVRIINNYGGKFGVYNHCIFWALLNNNEISVFNFDGHNPNIYEIEIPSMIEGCKVTTIIEYSFYTNMKLQEIVIPDSVDTIKNNAFLGWYLTVPVPYCSWYEPVYIFCESSGPKKGWDDGWDCIFVDEIDGYIYADVIYDYVGIKGITDNNLRWIKQKDNTIAIYGYLRSPMFETETLIIPSELNGLKVTTIKKFAFVYLFQKPSKIFIPKSIVKIENYAFYKSYISKPMSSNSLTLLCEASSNDVNKYGWEQQYWNLLVYMNEDPLYYPPGSDQIREYPNIRINVVCDYII